MSPSWVRSYFHLDLDWQALHRTFSDDPNLRSAVAAYPGLRLVRDPWWPCLVGFLCSPLKPISEIRRLHWKLRQMSGLDSFPGPEALLAVGEVGLRRCGLGYRARSIAAVARMVAEGRWTWDGVEGMPLAEASARLQLLPGVGEKIARCVLLYTGVCLDAFPVDVWTARILEKLYWRRKRPPRQAELVKMADDRFGPYGGIAQLYLFHWYRARRELLGKQDSKLANGSQSR